MNSMELAMRKVFDDAALDTCHVSDTAPEDVSDHQVIFDEGFRIDERFVSDIVETAEARKQRDILKRAGWLKEEPEAEALSRTAQDLLNERNEKYKRVVRVIKRKELN